MISSGANKDKPIPTTFINPLFLYYIDERRVRERLYAFSPLITTVLR